MGEMPQVVERFWEGIDTHDWDLVASTIADDFVRIGMNDTEADTSRGKEPYLAFVSGVISRFDRHSLQSRSGFVSADGRRVVHEALETIQPPGEEPLAMRFLNVMEINEDGLIAKLDIYWKTPPRTPPSWIEVDSVMAGDS